MGLSQVIKCVCMCGCVWGGGGQDFALKARWQAEDSIHLGGTCFCAGHPSKNPLDLLGQKFLTLMEPEF